MFEAATHLMWASEGWTAELAASLWLAESATGLEPTWIYPHKVRNTAPYPVGHTTKILNLGKYWLRLPSYRRICGIEMHEISNM